jgi:hypothetical protein
MRFLLFLVRFSATAPRGTLCQLTAMRITKMSHNSRGVTSRYFPPPPKKNQKNCIGYLGWVLVPRVFELTAAGLLGFAYSRYGHFLFLLLCNSRENKDINGKATKYLRICRVQSSGWRLPKYWPPTPSPPSECVLPSIQRRGGGG